MSDIPTQDDPTPHEDEVAEAQAQDDDDQDDTTEP